MTFPPVGDVLAALNKATEELRQTRGEVAALKTDVNERTAALHHYGRVNRIIGAVAVLLVIAVAVLGGIQIDTNNRATRNSATIQSVHDANLSGCQYNNIRLARQKAIIQAILTPRTTQPPAVVLYLEQARARVAIGWAPRNCGAAYPEPK